jgi:hypothetical protein
MFEMYKEKKLNNKEMIEILGRTENLRMKGD